MIFIEEGVYKTERSKPLAAKLLEYVDTIPIDDHELSKLFNNK